MEVCGAAAAGVCNKNQIPSFSSPGSVHFLLLLLCRLFVSISPTLDFSNSLPDTSFPYLTCFSFLAFHFIVSVLRRRASFPSSINQSLLPSCVSFLCILPSPGECSW
ncbi:hypothetical protein B0T09DRAFT_64504 [Sordaria sp. MPI-SDFR-AT-0083]|nr:hypothetical protein B0T09DRAFT_64504 [Sordaria sp. MPI-SDFR-AT-0083]